MIKKLMTGAFGAAMVVSPAVVSAGAFGDQVAPETVVVAPQQDTAVAPVVGSLNGGLIAGAAVIALVALASSSGSTSSTNGTN
ncbi:MAG: hypothetical protein IKD58_11540 [Loktanella sp.]|nr:hypothetical protein [Loktanella sp.]